ncbi:MAG TPA: hypothetical protein ENK46_04625 [Flavobacteriia bacterium]|nr:hypothetical protein [Flavobacteriia bacterium]
MKFIKKLKGLILPEVIDFFGELTQQSNITESVIKKLVSKYTSGEDNDILNLIKEAKKSRKEKLKQLEKVFITPVDREAISRSYSYLYWIVLSVEHLINELAIYDIHHLKEYEKILTLLQQQITELTMAFSLFNTKKYDVILKKVNHIIHLDNELVLVYSKELNLLFQKKEMNTILKHKEILSQLKEISKRIHFCANQIEDIVFKVD